MSQQYSDGSVTDPLTNPLQIRYESVTDPFTDPRACEMRPIPKWLRILSKAEMISAAPSA